MDRSAQNSVCNATTSGVDDQDLKTSLAKLDPLSPDYGKFDEHGRLIPKWHEQITIRAVLVAAVLGFVFNLMVLKLGFTVGIIPSLNIAAGLLGFVLTKVIASVTKKLGISSKPFTQQENTVIQTCAVACYSLAFTGGFTNYLIAMDWNTYVQTDGAETGGEVGKPVYPLPASVIQPSYVKYMVFMILVYYIGIFVLIPLRKVFVIDYRLVYPSGTATGVVISEFHTPLGEENAKKQVKVLGQWFAGSFFFSFFKWFFGGFAERCGFSNWPSLGLEAFKWKWYFDFSQTFVGVGMICPYEVNYSIMFGAIMSYGIMWPLVNNRAGDWFPAKYGQGTSNPRGIAGYKIFVSAAIILGDGLYNLIKILIITGKHMYKTYTKGSALPSYATSTSAESDAPAGPGLSADSREEHSALRDAVFLQDRLPWYVGVAGYILLAAVAMGGIPALFPGVKPYHVLVGYIIAPVFAFANSYGCGLTDWSMITTYGKIGIFLFASWAGAGGNGIVVGLVMCGVYCSIAGASGDLMQDFKTGYITLANPTSMFISQLIGCTLACFITPAAFWLFWKAFTIGDPNGEYKAPFAVLFRTMALIAVEGVSNLPRYCVVMGAAFFAAAIIVNLVRDFAVPKKYRFWVPIPMAVAIPVYIGGYFAISMLIGSVARYLWSRANAASEKTYSMIVASALIAGDGVWTVPAAILAMANVHPPICMWFFPTKVFEAKFGDLPQYLR